ncbi:hypothetical protein PILCRDRAFT_5986 [Piloderma croceum F 1598]|uniref:CHAT domain-containing protein n=1 Tax=Piloderma croceum (strain F 1598) TaxID=765440 RepID=A0A0C3BFA0_PILCF|nr:hypothetical protein PILCRDRAFT_5986 [Piloderma croceum F 1598]
MTALAKSFQDNETGEFCVKVGVDKMREQMEVVKGSDSLSWNSSFLFAGDSSSILSLSIVQNTSRSTLRSMRIFSADIVLGVLLEQCDNNEFITLEMPSTLSHTGFPITVTFEVKLTELDLNEVAIHMDSVGTNQLRCFEDLGDMSDLENAMLNTHNAVELADEGHPNKPWYLSNHAICQHTRFERLGDLLDLENAILNQQKAVDLTDDGHPNQPMYFSNLGISQLRRFERHGDLSDLENAISNKQKAVEFTDDGHPDRAIHFSNLGTSQLRRFERLGDLSDLENAIFNKQQAVELMDDRYPDPMYFSTLGISQLRRFERLGDLSDLENAIFNTQKAIELTDDGHPDQPMHFSNLGISQETRFERLGDLSDLENAISNQQKAVAFTDDGHPSKAMHLSNLGISQQTRFERLGDLLDLDNAVLNIQKAVDLTDDEHSDLPMYFSNLGISQETRFQRLGNLSDIENAISNKQQAVVLTNDGHPSKAIRLSNLGISQQNRFERLGDLSDLENAIVNQQKAVALTDDGHPSKAIRLSNLGISQQTRFEHLSELLDLEDAILNIQKAVDLTDDGHPDQPMYFSNLGNSQKTRFEHLGDLADLENAISNQTQAVALTDDDHPSKGQRLLAIGTSLQSRFDHLGNSGDLTACILSYKAAAQLKAAYPSHALFAARQWAQTSHHNHNFISALDGYRTVLELFSKVSWLGLDTRSRQDTLLQEKPENLGCLAATCAIQLGRLEEAVELLDLGRSVFWRQASSLRGDFELLREEDAELAERLAEISRQLDAGNFNNSYNTVAGYNVGGDRRSAEEIGRERRRLVGKWEGLVDRVRRLPRFEFFLKPIPFHQLCQACTAGQVIIINTSTYGVDALIFSATGSVEHVPLPDIDHETLVGLSENIILNQPSNGSETQRRNYTIRFLKPALQTVWNDILVHIFGKIHISQADTPVLPQHRISWYLTGPLTFIPVHASGPLRGEFDVSRLVISSYVTSLESLFRTRKKNAPVSKEHQNILCVSQPETPGQTPLPETTEELNDVVEIFLSSGWSNENIVRLSGTAATVDAVSTALNFCSWIHLACHGFQDSRLGMKSAFVLHNGHLELGEIASKRLSNGQFAMLSACQAASGQKELPGEAMHLAAGLQFAGFPSVIATLWRIRDEDAPKVADLTYRFLLRHGELDPSEAATALNRAILHLREDPSITVDRWAPFIHLGI